MHFLFCFLLLLIAPAPFLTVLLLPVVAPVGGDAETELEPTGSDFSTGGVSADGAGLDGLDLDLGLDFALPPNVFFTGGSSDEATRALVSFTPSFEFATALEI